MCTFCSKWTKVCDLCIFSVLSTSVMKIIENSLRIWTQWIKTFLWIGRMSYFLPTLFFHYIRVAQNFESKKRWWKMTSQEANILWDYSTNITSKHIKQAKGYPKFLQQMHPIAHNTKIVHLLVVFLH